MILNSARKTVLRHIRRSLITGLLVLLPVALTYVIVRFLFDIVDGFLRPWIEWLLERFGIEWSLPGPGVVLAVIIVYLIGAFATFRLGSMVVDWIRKSLLRIPFIGTLYSANRQLIESFSGASVTGFKRVVLVQFPRADAWSLGFLTGLTDAADVEKLIMTYVPTAPLPNSGFVVLMPPEDVLDTDLTVPEAMQLIFSGGIVSPRTIKTRKIDVTEVERQLRDMEQPAHAVTRAVGTSVTAAATKAAKLSVGKIRQSSARALHTVGAAAHGPSSVARDAMVGAMHAVDSLGVWSAEHVRDATMGVVLGVRDATGVTTRILHDAVAGALYHRKGRDEQTSTIQGAAEGTMQVAASVGIPADLAVRQISRAAVEALKNNEEDLIEGGKAAMRGIISGSATAGENVSVAAEQSAYELVSNAAMMEFPELGQLAEAIADAAAQAAAELSLDANELARTAAKGSLRAAEEAGHSAGEAVKAAIEKRFGAL